MNLSKKLAVFIAVLTLGMPYGYADSKDDPKPLTLKEILENDPTRPKAPSRVRISAYYDGDAVVLTSTVATMAEVVISDTETGAYCFNGLVALAPDFRCTVCPTLGSALTITVTVGSTVYEGTLIF